MADNIKFGIEIDTRTGQAQLVKLADGFKKVGDVAKKTAEASKKSFADSIAGVERFTNILSNLTAAFSQVFNSFNEAIGLSNQYETALMGLTNTAEAFGQSQTEASENALKLSEDGLVSVTANASALKFLMQTGFDVKQSMNLAEAAKDIGAFGRSTADFSEAMIGFGKGLKDNNKELFENIGFTTSLSTIMKRANIDISEGIDLRNNLAQREALYNAVLKEGELVKGNANKYLETSAGAMQTVSTQITMLKKDVGDFAKQIIGEMLPSIKSLISWLKDNLAVVIAAISVAITTTLVVAISTAIVAIGALGAAVAIATGGISLLVGAVAALIAYNLSDNMIKNAKATKLAAAEAQAYADKLKTLTNEQKEAEKNRLNFMLDIRKSENVTVTKEWMEQRERARNAAEKDKTVELEKFQRLSELRNANIQLMNDYSQKLAAIDKNITTTNKREADKQAEDKSNALIAANENAKKESEKAQKTREKEAEDIKKKNLENLNGILDQTKFFSESLLEIKTESISMFQGMNEVDANRQKALEEQRLSEAQMAADAEIELAKKVADEKKKADDEAAQVFYQNNQTMIDLARGSYEALSSGISSFVQVGIQGGNALKAAWQSFSSAIVGMIGQMITKVIAFKLVTTALNFFAPGAGSAFGALFGEKGGLPSQFQRKKLAGGGVLWQGASHAQGGIPVEVEGDEITLTKGVYRNPVLRGIASMINVAAGGVSIPNAPRASMLANGGLAALAPASNNNNDNSIVFAMVGQLVSTVDGLTKQIDKFKATDDRTIFMKSNDGQKEVAAVV